MVQVNCQVLSDVCKGKRCGVRPVGLRGVAEPVQQVRKGVSGRITGCGVVSYHPGAFTAYFVKTASSLRALSSQE